MTLPLDRLFEKAYEDRKLLYVSLELTYNCNFACRFCYNPVKRTTQEREVPESRDAEPLRLDEIFKILSRLKDSGVLFLTLTGGEPLLHGNFWEIMEEAVRLSFAVRIFTNGALIDERTANRFEKTRPYCVEMSIYGASEKGYEETNGRGDDFHRVVRAIRLLKERRINTFMKCVLTSITEKEMDAIQDLSDDLGCPLFWDPVITPSEDGLQYPLKFRASDAGLDKLIGHPRFRIGASPFDRGEGDSVCNIGRISLGIDPYGSVVPCMQWKESLGNVRSEDIMKIWNESPRFPELIALSGRCLEKIRMATEDHVYCFNCMGKSRLLYGDPTIPDEYELKIAALRKKYDKSRGS